MLQNSKMRITGNNKRAKGMFFLIMMALFLFTENIDLISAEGITSVYPEASPTILEEVQRFYEISERSLRMGYNVTIDKNSAFKTSIGGRDRYIITNNFTNDSINLIFLGSGKTLFNRALKEESYVIFKIDYLNLKFLLHSSNETYANIQLSMYEDEIPEEVDYYELFDIQVRLADNTIYSPQDLSSITEFINFGEGPSHVRLIYSVINIDTGEEYYTAIDEKVIETTEIVQKNFYSLNIPYGKYVLRTTIYYGDNQEATSEDSFTYSPISKRDLIKQPAVFIGMILISFGLVLFFRRKISKSKKLF